MYDNYNVNMINTDLAVCHDTKSFSTFLTNLLLLSNVSVKIETKTNSTVNARLAWVEPLTQTRLAELPL